MNFFNILCGASAELLLFLGTSRLFLAKMIHCSLAFSFRRILYATVAHLRDFYKDCVGGQIQRRGRSLMSVKFMAGLRSSWRCSRRNFLQHINKFRKNPSTRKVFGCALGHGEAFEGKLGLNFFCKDSVLKIFSRFLNVLKKFLIFRYCEDLRTVFSCETCVRRFSV